MPRLVALVLLACVLLPAAAVLAAGTPAPPPGWLPPTAPDADFNGSLQSSGIVAAMHMRGPEKIIAVAVALLLLLALAMFAAMLRQVYGGTGSARR
jgi:hypothetical protein